MVRVVFVDGTEEIFESARGKYEYDQKEALFKVWRKETGWVMMPREFVKYITLSET